MVPKHYCAWSDALQTALYVQRYNAVVRQLLIDWIVQQAVSRSLNDYVMAPMFEFYDRSTNEQALQRLTRGK